LMVYQLLLSGHIHTHDIEESFRTRKPSTVYCWGILSQKPASSIGNTYFHAGTSFIVIPTEVKLLTAVQWEVYLMMFAECSMEVYETAHTVWVEEAGPVDGISRGQTLSIVCGKASSRYNSRSMLHMS